MRKYFRTVLRELRKLLNLAVKSMRFQLYTITEFDFRSRKRSLLSRRKYDKHKEMNISVSSESRVLRRYFPIRL